MANVLYIQASPRGHRSKSNQVADAFVAAYQRQNPDDVIDQLNVFVADLPTFCAAATAAKFKVPNKEPVSAEESAVWAEVEAIIERFKAADKVVVATPMWNFNIPYRLKQYFDIIVQPGYTFTVGENGYEGLVTGKPMAGIYARGGAYSEGSGAEAFDRQKPYVEQMFGFMGFTEMHGIVVEPTLQQGEDGAKKAVAAALAEAEKLAEKF